MRIEENDLVIRKVKEEAKQPCLDSLSDTQPGVQGLCYDDLVSFIGHDEEIGESSR